MSGGQKSIFITGAASGMGRAAAHLFANAGWFVGGFDVNEVGLGTLAEELGHNQCMTGVLDVRNMDAFNAAVAEFGEKTGGTMDVMFNNAGIGETGKFGDVPYDRAMNVVDINLRGVINGVYASLPLLKNTPDSLLFNNSSSSATYGMPGLAVYSATKHGVKGLTEALSIEFAEYGVRVADSLPGLINTPLLLNTPNHSADSAEGPGMTKADLEAVAPKKGPMRLIEPEEVAQAVWASYHTDKKRLHWYVPKGIGLIDRIKGIKPEWARAMIKRATASGMLGSE
ncbi:MAG: SDR family oxidoreductase [Alphaproteobacteria bacterium]